MIAGMPFGPPGMMAGSALGGGVGSMFGGGTQAPQAAPAMMAPNQRQIGNITPPVTVPSVAPVGNLTTGGASQGAQMTPQIAALLQRLMQTSGGGGGIG